MIQAIINKREQRVEAVAQSLYEYVASDRWYRAPEDHKENWRKQARVAIKAAGLKVI